MEAIEKMLSDLEGQEFPVAILSVFSKLYDIYESKKGGSSRVTLEMVAITKRMHDYATEKMIAVYRENIVLKTRMEEAEKRYVDNLALAERITRKSTEVVTEERVETLGQKRPPREDHAVIVTANDSNQDMNILKNEIKEICKARSTIPTPGDVVVTKQGQVILRMKNKSDAEQVKEVLTESENLKEKAKVVMPLRKRERVLVLSVEADVEEDKFKEDFGRVIGELKPDADFGISLRNKLKNPDLTGEARATIEELYADHKIEFRIIRRSKTKAGKMNWLVDVDRETK